MEKLKKNSELIKRCLIILLAGVLMASSIVLFSLSLEVYEGGFDADMDSIVLFFCGVALLVYGIYSVYALEKGLSTQAIYYGSFGAISVLIGFYPLGVFFKAMAKHKPFIENQEYLYIGILGIVMIVYLIFSYISERKDTQA
ncbi:MAG: hypothetical protein NC310_06700 [Roseburia sp.]|nr:hypothetical protein [Anaeroplasma bactoclasticum]MCM1196738.1 hypothetical protein [Roseburia sp.]MCM1557493.1 hypothetical protein [Anaeroplasma bactoclasticum]